MGKAAWNQHLLLIFKGEKLTVSIAKSISQSKINCHVEDRAMQTGYQLCLRVISFLKMQSTQRSGSLAESLVI